MIHPTSEANHWEITLPITGHQTNGRDLLPVLLEKSQPAKNRIRPLSCTMALAQVINIKSFPQVIYAHGRTDPSNMRLLSDMFNQCK